MGNTAYDPLGPYRRHLAGFVDLVKRENYIALYSRLGGIWVGNSFSA